MDLYGCSPSPLSVACSELYEKMWSSDPQQTALLVVDRLFNNRAIDLLSVFRSSNTEFANNEFERTIDLIGICSPAFSALMESEGDQVFEYFMESFCKHLECSTCGLPKQMVDSSVYMHLLAEYVCFMMPIEPLNAANRTHRPELSPKTLSSTLCASSPLRLFNEEALQRYSTSPAKNSLRTLRTYSQSLSPHFVSFICILVNSLCSLSTWPSEYRLSALRYVLKQYHIFVLTPTEDGNLAQVKSQLLHNPPFIDQLYTFLDSMFAKWPDNAHFSYLFEVWMTWIRPWRCVQERGENDSNRMQSFVEYNRRFFTNLTDAFFNRLISLDNPDSVHAISNYLTILVSEPLRKAFDSLKYDLEAPVVKLGAAAAKWADYERKLIVSEQQRLGQLNWFNRLIKASENEAHLRKLNDTCTALNDLTMPIADACDSTESDLLDEEAMVPPYVLNNSPSQSTPPWAKPIPDHYVDPGTNLMYLTDLGRKQVRLGTHRFDLSHCHEAIPPLEAPQRSDEVWWLAKLLYKLSHLLNQTPLIMHLSKVYNDHTMTGMIARLILDPAYPRKAVPAFSSRIRAMKPSLNMRRLAQYKYVAPTCVFMVLLLMMPFHFAMVVYVTLMVLAALS